MDIQGNRYRQKNENAVLNSALLSMYCPLYNSLQPISVSVGLGVKHVCKNK